MFQKLKVAFKKLRAKKLMGQGDLASVAVTVVIVLIILTIGLFIVQSVNQTTPVHIGINPQQIFTLIGVALIVAVASFIIYELRNRLTTA